jgi:hypothetical protein
LSVRTLSDWKERDDDDFVTPKRSFADPEGWNSQELFRSVDNFDTAIGHLVRILDFPVRNFDVVNPKTSRVTETSKFASSEALVHFRVPVITNQGQTALLRQMTAQAFHVPIIRSKATHKHA